ncbi:hypothetical protein INR49_014896 [Caranx melampygus]|nr:hypothetical protein INR49_014896 [Caranx melampygus]
MITQRLRGSGVCFSFLCVVNGGLMFSHMLAKSLFLLRVIYSNDQDIKQCFVGKSPPEFYGL